VKHCALQECSQASLLRGKTLLCHTSLSWCKGAVTIEGEELLKARRTGLILALDMEDRERAVSLAQETCDFVDALKIGYPLVLSTGLDVIGELRDAGKPVIADLKVADVPHISSHICRLASQAGADYVIVHGFTGGEVMEACAREARIIVVCDMTHKGAAEFISCHAMEIALQAREHAAGIVAPATRPEAIKSLRAVVGELAILSPGVKAQGAAPGSALKAGADFEIIGRAICNSPEPVREAERLCRELEVARRI